MDLMGIELLFKGQNFLRILGGLWVSVRISLISVAISIGLGLLVGALMTLRRPVVRAITRVYLEIVRIMPQMVLLFIVYFGT
ncbi:MAG: ABC transporter permease subunit, partial [Lachnospiraceae bacterium]|nr:ABC transporter permease subunit [Lachnospiraceae bacterium]